MKLEYIVRCQYFGKNKVYSKVFYSEKERNDFKNWLSSQRGYTNIKFLKKLVESTNKLKQNELEINFENLTKRQGLTEYLLNNKKDIIFYKFIYCLIKDKEVVYVGKTINIQNRILTHKRDENKDFDSFSIIAQLPNDISEQELLKLEEKYIKLLKPKLNITHNVNGKETNKDFSY